MDPTFQVMGIKADGTRELCFARRSRQSAESVAATLRTMTERGYVEVLIEEEPPTPPLESESREFRL
jgi:hypothetical protein